MIPQDIIDAYDFGTVRSVKPISVGLIHQTYQISAKNGTFIAQRLHPVLASPAIGKDFFVVTTFLNDRGFPAPKTVVTKKLQVLAKDGEGRVWRVQTFLPGTTFTAVRDAKMAREAGAMFGQFHKTLSGLKYEFKSKKILHETDKIFAKFKKVLEKDPSWVLNYDLARAVAYACDEMENVRLPASLPVRAIHGDPKISNLLFDAKGRATGVVDLDTCNRRPLLVETGDMFRSWCGKQEDDPKNTFRLEIFRAGWNGYAKAAEGFITARERRLVPRSVATITLELAVRFLTDVFDDNYFGWDDSRYPSRRAHNLARAFGQLALYRDIVRKMDKMKAIVA